MSLRARLTLSLALVMVVWAVVPLVTALCFFPSSPDPLSLLLSAGIHLLAFAAALTLPAPIELALTRERGPDDAFAARAGLHLPGRMALVVLGLTVLDLAIVMLVNATRGVPSDVATSSAAVSAASGLMAAILVYANYTNLIGPILETLGVAVEPRGLGTFLGKLIWIGLGVAMVLLLLVFAVVRVRFGAALEQAVALARDKVAPGGSGESPIEGGRIAFWSNMAWLFLCLHGVAGFLIVASARSITWPLRSLGAATQRIANGDLSANPLSVSNDEIGRLAADFRRMAQRLKGLLGAV